MTTTTTNNDKTINKSGIDLDQAVPNDRHRILVVDDEPDTVTLLKHVLIRDGYDVSGATSGKEALVKINEVKPSLVLLDLMMPGMDGWETFHQMQLVNDLPVIVISALAQSQYIVKALELGADDYITKPFEQAEVKARVNAVLRRAAKPKVMNRIGFSDIQLLVDLDTQEISYHGKRIQLTGKMFEVLALLAKKAPHVATYDEILNAVWGENNTAARNRLKYLVYLLRNEFNRVDPAKEIIENVDRLGYRLCPD
jgi:two-component system, OmpR family, alkaline phosphatase synthesis response regulator PhoP